MGQLSNIPTRWHYQTVIKERQIKVDSFYEKAVKKNSIACLFIHKEDENKSSEILQGFSINLLNFFNQFIADSKKSMYV